MSDTAVVAVVKVFAEADIVSARQRGRAMAAEQGFGGTDQTLLATAISELARNIISYAGNGQVELRMLDRDGRRGIEITARDEGPGIADVDAAMRDGYSTGGGLGIGLPGARRIVDEFEIQSSPGAGTVVTLRRWVGL